MIIEAGLGLGEAIVSGQITPDSYVVEKEPRQIVDTNIATQTKGLYRAANGGNEWRNIPTEQGKQKILSEAEILELSELVLKIENHYGFPCDIEWAFESGKFYITQSRPITTLQKQDISSGMKDYDPSNYVRMFAGKSFVFILSDIFLNYYNALGVLSVQDKESWMSFLPRKSQEQTLREGKELYTTKEKYDEYNKKFQDYIQSSTTFFQSVLAKDEVLVDEVERFFKLVSEHFSFYSKTEFFYTDLLDQESMALTVQGFDALKLGGRSHLNKLIFEDTGYVKSLLKKISNQTGVPESSLSSYSVAEIVELARSGKKVDESDIAKRSVFFASGKVTLFGDESIELVNEFLSTYRDISDTIKGTIANKGKVRGKARVFIPDWNDFDKIAADVEKMEKGEILIAETTSPEIIQACKKAAAIITNQGGMLSHAAIVSREINIPCIIGTDKDVILNIRTGDEVEVDANKGIVRIYKQ